MSLLLRVVVLTVAASAFHSQAACDQMRPVQFIDIVQEDGKAVISNKPQSTRCEVDNSAQQSQVRLKWVFQQLNCQPGECLIELSGGHATLPPGTLQCDMGNANNRQCQLNIRKLQRYCDTHDTANTDHCEIRYDIKVRGEPIDPSIIIKPRPTAEE